MNSDFGSDIFQEPSETNRESSREGDPRDEAGAKPRRRKSGAKQRADADEVSLFGSSKTEPERGDAGADDADRAVARSSGSGGEPASDDEDAKPRRKKKRAARKKRTRAEGDHDAEREPDTEEAIAVRDAHRDRDDDSDRDPSDDDDSDRDRSDGADSDSDRDDDGDRDRGDGDNRDRSDSDNRDRSDGVGRDRQDGEPRGRKRGRRRGRDRDRNREPKPPERERDRPRDPRPPERDRVRDRDRDRDRGPRPEPRDRPAAVPIRQRIAIFVDASEILARATDDDTNLSFGHMRRHITGTRSPIRALAYFGAEDEALAPGLGQGGFEPVALGENSPSRVAIAVDAMAIADRVDCVVLVPGSSELNHLASVLRARGVRVETASFAEADDSGVAAQHHHVLGAESSFKA